MDKNNITRKQLNHYRYLKEKSSEKWLWKSVICQAIYDATTLSKTKEDLEAKQAAIKWLLGSGDDFKAVCELAEIDDKLLRSLAKFIIKNYAGSSKKNSKYKFISPE